MPKRHETVVDDYRIVVRGDVARVWDINHCEPLGCVWIDHTNAWNVEYKEGVGYLPINDILRCLGYPERRFKDMTIII